MKSRALIIKSILDHDDRPVSVDILCSVYNHEKYLRQALDGMLMQRTNFPFRIIIHDDASTDNSTKIIKEYQEKYPNKIVAVIEKQNLYQQGIPKYKIMFPYFTSKYTAYCEGDDFWIDKDKLQKQIDYLEMNKDCQACYHNIMPVNENGQYDESLRLCYKHLEEGDYSQKELKDFIFKTQTASLVRRNINPFLNEKDKQMIQDAKCNGDEKNLIINGTIGRIHYLSDVMAAHRRVFTGDSYTAQHTKKSDLEKFIILQNKYIEKCKLYTYFSGEKLYPYNQIIDALIKGLATRKIGVGKGDFKKICKSVHIPYYAYIVYVPHFLFAIVRSIIRRLCMLLRIVISSKVTQRQRDEI